MTDRQKVAHLLRRFGLGAGELEMRQYEPLGPSGALDRLLDFEKVDEGFPVSPWEFCFEEGSDEVYLDPFRTLGYWCLRLLFTKRPLQEKLTLFWHDHFGVSAAKVEFGPMMLKHVETLRKHGSGKFEDLLRAVAQDPAMVRFLDLDSSMKGTPNENFARELLELYTLGIGHYTESDIRECARAFTGRGIRYLVFEPGAEKLKQTAIESMRSGKPMIAFCHTPELHDDGEKTILGQTGPFDGEGVIRLLCSRTETAAHICRKLWEWFAYPNPEPAVVSALTAEYKRTNGHILSVLREMARRPEFWGEKCYRKQPKSPVDFTVGLTRQFGVTEFLMGLRGKVDDPLKPIAKPVRDISGFLAGLMSQQGMLLLYPPDVGGWEWGENWITSQTMALRIRLGEQFMGVGQTDKGLATLIATRLKTDRNPQSPSEVIDGLLAIFDGEVSSAQKDSLAVVCEGQGGVKALDSPETASIMLGAVLKLLFATPEFQMG